MSEIKGLNSLMSKFDALYKTVADQEFVSIVDRVNKGIVQADAKLNCPVRSVGGGGELRNSIKTSAALKGTTVVAETFTNKAYAAYPEFGTGPVGEANHEGISPEVVPSYSQHGWGIPADEVNEADAVMYHWPKRSYHGKDYYMTSGQPATPFMYPALKNNEDRVTKEIGKELSKSIRKKANK